MSKEIEGNVVRMMKWTEYIVRIGTTIGLEPWKDGVPQPYTRIGTRVEDEYSAMIEEMPEEKINHIGMVWLMHCLDFGSLPDLVRFKVLDSFESMYKYEPEEKEEMR